MLSKMNQEHMPAPGWMQAYGFCKNARKLFMKHPFPDYSNTGRNFSDGQNHQNTGNKVLYICSASGFGHGATGNAENDEDKLIKVNAEPLWGRFSCIRSRGCTPFRFFVCGILY